LAAKRFRESRSACLLIKIFLFMASKIRFQTPSGVKDLLPSEYDYYRKIYEVSREVAEFYSFGEIQTPIFEPADLFIRGIGQATELVEKQMYVFRTKGEDLLALRPEATAGIARAYIQHGLQSLPQPVKLWTFGPFYRYERPQAGRYRQFWQVDFEILGDGSPVMDAQIIQLLFEIFEELKIKDISVEINSIGDSQCRPYYKKILINHLRQNFSALCQDCRRRFKENPLRVLDCKEEKCQRVVNLAPQLVDHLCEFCKAHFKEVLEFLEELQIPYKLNPYLVRGLDYYTKTVFEIFAKDSKFSKNALAGGGRYDSLLKILGRKDVPAVGAAFGVERIIEFLEENKISILKAKKKPEVFLAQLGKAAKMKSLILLRDFRRAGIYVAESLGKDSLRAQLKNADRLGCRYVLILGQQEVLEQKILIRDLKSGKQEELKLEKVVAEIKKRLKND
jgi:histidyl-tRNA synthetase